MSWLIERKEKVAIVTMNTNKANVQNEDFFAHLHEAFDRLEKDFSDCSVIFTAEGNIFSAGIDFDYSFRLFAEKNRQKSIEWFERYRKTNIRLFTYPRPTIAAVNGHAFAGGLITALACDYRIAVDKNAKFALNEVPIGIPMPSTYNEIIRYAVGNHSAIQTILFGETFNSQQAKELGFFHQLVDSSTLLDRATAQAKLISSDCFAAYATTKKALQKPTIDRLERFAKELDDEAAMTMSSEESLKTQNRIYRQLKGKIL